MTHFKSSGPCYTPLAVNCKGAGIDNPGGSLVTATACTAVSNQVAAINQILDSYCTQLETAATQLNTYTDQIENVVTIAELEDFETQYVSAGITMQECANLFSNLEQAQIPGNQINNPALSKFVSNLNTTQHSLSQLENTLLWDIDNQPNLASPDDFKDLKSIAAANQLCHAISTNKDLGLTPSVGDMLIAANATSANIPNDYYLASSQDLARMAAVFATTYSTDTMADIQAGTTNAYTQCVGTSATDTAQCVTTNTY